MTNSQKIDVVLNLLGQMTIPATFDNTNKLYTVYTVLAEVGQDLNRIEQAEAEKTEEESKDDRKSDTK